MNKSIVFIAVLFGIIKMNYFGWNFEPQSDNELFCDGIMFLILALAMLKPKKD